MSLLPKINQTPLEAERLCGVGGREPMFLHRVKTEAEPNITAALRDNGKQDLLVQGDDGRQYVVQSRVLMTTEGKFPGVGDRFEAIDPASGKAVVSGTVTFADQERPRRAGVVLCGGGGVGGLATSMMFGLHVGLAAVPFAGAASVLALVAGYRALRAEDARTAKNGAPGAILPYVDSVQILS